LSECEIFLQPIKLIFCNLHKSIQEAPKAPELIYGHIGTQFFREWKPSTPVGRGVAGSTEMSNISTWGLLQRLWGIYAPIWWH